MEVFPCGLASGVPVGVSNSLLYGNASGALAGIADVATGQVLTSQGASSVPAWSATAKNLTWGSLVADGGVAHIIDTDNTFTSGKLLSVRNNTGEKAYIGYDGEVRTGVGGLSIRQTNDALTGTILLLSGIGFYNATIATAMDVMNQTNGVKTIQHLSTGVVFNGGGYLSFTPNAQSGLGVANFGKFYFKAPADTARQAGQEVSEFYFDMNRSIQWATGALAAANAFNILAPTYSFVAASTIDDASTFTIDRAPQAGTNATITRAYALRVKAGTASFEGRIRRPSGQIQTTIGANGAASALTANPLGYFKHIAEIAGVETEVIVPFYNA